MSHSNICDKYFDKFPDKHKFSNLGCFLKSLSPEEIVFLSSAISVALGSDLTKGETLLLSSFFASVSKDLSLMAIQEYEEAGQL